MKKIYLNNAATSYPKPESVIKAIEENLHNIPYEPGRMGGSGEDILALCRKSLAKLLNAKEVERVILTPGATYSLNLLILGLLNNKRNVHCLTTTIEHNSVLRPLNYISKRNNIEITHFPLEKDLDNKFYFDLDKFKMSFKENTELVIINHASNVIGIILPIEEISKICYERKIPLIIDTSQSIGCIDIDISKLLGDVYIVFAGHKGLFGPAGTGGFYIKGKLFEPIIQGGTGIRSDLMEQPKDLPIYYEAGTQNLSGFAGLRAGVEFVLKEKVENIGKRKSYLISHLIDLIKDIPTLKLFLPKDENFSAGVLSFKLEGWTPEEIGYIFEESFDIICRTGLHCAPLVHKNIGSLPEGTVRISVSIFNKEEDINLCAKAIRTLAQVKN